MTDQNNVQRAHDLLTALVKGDIEIGASAQFKREAHIARDVLCWILQHGGNMGFAKVLEDIKAACDEHGVVETFVQ